MMKHLSAYLARRTLKNARAVVAFDCLNPLWDTTGDSLWAAIYHSAAKMVAEAR
jgi:hypothetical protein